MRWLELKADRLAYFTSPGSSKPRRELRLVDCVNVEVGPTTALCCGNGAALTAEGLPVWCCGPPYLTYCPVTANPLLLAARR